MAARVTRVTIPMLCLEWSVTCVLLQPFYGGKKHRVSAEVFNPGEKKAFLSVDGEWNGCMTAKWQDGVSTIILLVL